MPALLDRIVVASLTVKVLPSPKLRLIARGGGFWMGDAFGEAESGKGGASVAVLWPGGQVEELKLPKVKEPELAFARGADAVGTIQARGGSHAALFKRSREGIALTDLHSKAYAKTWARGCDGAQQVGGGEPKDSERNETALLWTPDKVVELHGPEPNRMTNAHGVADGIQVGVYGPSSEQHAMLWRGTTASAVNLNPSDKHISEANAVADGEIVGFSALGEWPDFVMRPCLWRGDAASWTDLLPDGYEGGSADHCAAGFQVGVAHVTLKEEVSHAMLWGGSAKEFLDLHTAVKDFPFNRSSARALLIEGRKLRIVGSASVMTRDGTGPLYQKEHRAVVWEMELR